MSPPPPTLDYRSPKKNHRDPNRDAFRQFVLGILGGTTASAIAYVGTQVLGNAMEYRGIMDRFGLGLGLFVACGKFVVATDLNFRRGNSAAAAGLITSIAIGFNCLCFTAFVNHTGGLN